MRIFAFEHITGGGMLDDPQLSALAPEGEVMLRALVSDLVALPGVQVSVMRDPRLALDIPAKMFVPVSSGEFWTVFRKAARESDAVWPIAPEQDGLLSRVTLEILGCGRTLLGSRPDAIEITTSKRATAVALSRSGIAVIPCYSAEQDVPADVHEVVAKPDDGAGCQDTRLFRSRPALREWLRRNVDQGRILQPFIHGEARSLSLLCCEGRARLLACNRQKVILDGEAFRFDGVSVNAVSDTDGRYARFAAVIARALPGLWGYCGVDLIETASGPVVVEVNPRLTTSYAGLRAAIGVNPAHLVLDLPGSLAVVAAPSAVSRTIAGEIADAG